MYARSVDARMEQRRRVGVVTSQQSGLWRSWMGVCVFLLMMTTSRAFVIGTDACFPQVDSHFFRRNVSHVGLHNFTVYFQITRRI